MVIASFTLFAGNALAAEDLKLNPDILKQTKIGTENESLYSSYVTAQDLFLGIDANGCTLTDIVISMGKYGYECKRVGTPDTYGMKIDCLYFGTEPWWTEDIDSYLDPDSFTPLQKSITIYPDTEFEVSFLVERYDEIDKPPVSSAEMQALIDHITLINGTNSTYTTQTEVPPSLITGVYYYWAHNEIGWWVQGSDGSYLTNQWYCSPGSGLYYYLGADGYMLTNSITPDGFMVGPDGVWLQ